MIKRSFVISDIHLGCHSNSMEWIDIIKNYFYEFFIPLIKREYKQGDILIIAGDTFNSRQSLDLVVLNTSISIFLELNKIFENEIYVIAGNHDIYGKHTNDVTSIEMLSLIDDKIKVITGNETIDVLNNKIMLLSWCATSTEELEIINKTDADYLFCHTTIMGMKYNKFTMTQEGNNIKDFKKFKYVFSGHIHLSQVKNNFIMLGSPYEITRADEGNEKGVYLVDFETDTYKFLTLRFDEVSESNIDAINEKVKNNFININIDENVLNIFKNADILNSLNEYRKLDINTFSVNSEIDIGDVEINSEFNIIETISKFIDNMETTHDKDKLKNAIEKIYQRLTIN